MAVDEAKDKVINAKFACKTVKRTPTITNLQQKYCEEQFT